MRKDHVIRMGHVGRLVSQKNQARMIKGLAIVAGGDGALPAARDCGQRAADGPSRADRPCGRGRQRRRVTGALTREAVYEKLGQWDAFVMPSKFEGFCNALIEAMRRPALLPVGPSPISTRCAKWRAEERTLASIRYDPQAIGAAHGGRWSGLPAPVDPHRRNAMTWPMRWRVTWRSTRRCLPAGRPSVTARLPLVGKDVPGE